MQPRSRPYLKPSLTWGLVRVFALHKNYYGTPRPPCSKATDGPSAAKFFTHDLGQNL